MDRPSLSLDEHIERFRSYLLLLAGLHLDRPLRHKIEPSDIVQQTLMEAHLQRERLPMATDELAAWLRTALSNNLQDARRRLRRQKRDVARERSLDAQLAQSSQRLGAILAAGHSSPSQRAIRQEDLLRLADALANLPDGQRQAVILHHLQSYTLRETAQHLGKTEAAVAGLLHRGLQQLRVILAPLRPEDRP